MAGRKGGRGGRISPPQHSERATAPPKDAPVEQVPKKGVARKKDKTTKTLDQIMLGAHTQTVQMNNLHSHHDTRAASDSGIIASSVDAALAQTPKPDKSVGRQKATEITKSAAQHALVNRASKHSDSQEIGVNKELTPTDDQADAMDAQAEAPIESSALTDTNRDAGRWGKGIMERASQATPVTPGKKPEAAKNIVPETPKNNVPFRIPRHSDDKSCKTVTKDSNEQIAEKSGAQQEPQAPTSSPADSEEAAPMEVARNATAAADDDDDSDRITAAGDDDDSDQGERCRNTPPPSSTRLGMEPLEKTAVQMIYYPAEDPELDEIKEIQAYVEASSNPGFDKDIPYVQHWGMSMVLHAEEGFLRQDSETFAYSSYGIKALTQPEAQDWSPNGKTWQQGFEELRAWSLRPPVIMQHRGGDRHELTHWRNSDMPWGIPNSYCSEADFKRCLASAILKSPPEIMAAINVPEERLKAFFYMAKECCERDMNATIFRAINLKERGAAYGAWKNNSYRTELEIPPFFNAVIAGFSTCVTVRVLSTLTKKLRAFRDGGYMDNHVRDWISSTANDEERSSIDLLDLKTIKDYVAPRLHKQIQDEMMLFFQACVHITLTTGVFELENGGAMTRGYWPDEIMNRSKERNQSRMRCSGEGIHRGMFSDFMMEQDGALLPGDKEDTNKWLHSHLSPSFAARELAMFRPSTAYTHALKCLFHTFSETGMTFLIGHESFGNSTKEVVTTSVIPCIVNILKDYDAKGEIIEGIIDDELTENISSVAEQFATVFDDLCTGDAKDMDLNIETFNTAYHETTHPLKFVWGDLFTAHNCDATTGKSCDWDAAEVPNFGGHVLQLEGIVGRIYRMKKLSFGFAIQQQVHEKNKSWALKTVKEGHGNIVAEILTKKPLTSGGYEDESLTALGIMCGCNKAESSKGYNNIFKVRTIPKGGAIVGEKRKAQGSSSQRHGGTSHTQIGSQNIQKNKDRENRSHKTNDGPPTRRNAAQTELNNIVPTGDWKMDAEGQHYP